ADSRAVAAQSIARMSSPARYGRDPAMSEPVPRRALRMPPNESPISRRLGVSGKTTSVTGMESLLVLERDDRAVELRLGLGSRPETGPPEPLRSRRPAVATRLGEESRPKD